LSSILSDGMLDTAVCQTPKMPVAASWIAPSVL
jgi:hypothetical protein